MQAPFERVLGTEARPLSQPRPALTRGRRTSLLAAAVAVLATLTAAVLAMLGLDLAANRAPGFDPRAWESEANAALVAGFYDEVWNDGEMIHLAEDVRPDAVLHDPATGAMLSGPSGVAGYVAGLRQVFPDLTIRLDDVATQGDRVTVRFTARGTHRGTFLGAAGTGQSVAWAGMATYRIADRQIAEIWMSWDTYQIAQQIGLYLVPLADLDPVHGAPAIERFGRAR